MITLKSRKVYMKQIIIFIPDDTSDYDTATTLWGIAQQIEQGFVAGFSPRWYFENFCDTIEKS